MNPIILIPARLASTRFPQKMLATINGKPMIQRVWEQAMKANLSPVIVACDDIKIFNLINQKGGIAIMTMPNLPSGSDRILAALNEYDPRYQYDTIINLQGDLPTFPPAYLPPLIRILEKKDVDIATLGTLIHEERDLLNPNVVKIALAGSETLFQRRALYFSRHPIPHGMGPHYHHIGVYAYKRSALEKFVSLPPSPLETQEKLEQLRALEAGMNIEAHIVDHAPRGVDVKEDLEGITEII